MNDVRDFTYDEIESLQQFGNAIEKLRELHAQELQLCSDLLHASRATCASWLTVVKALDAVPTTVNVQLTSVVQTLLDQYKLTTVDIDGLETKCNGVLELLGVLRRLEEGSAAWARYRNGEAE